MTKKYNIDFENYILLLYDSGLSANEVSRKVNKQCTAITRVLKRNNRKISDGKGSNHSGWKGGRGIKCGYWTVYCPNHPRTLNNGRVFEHILIAEKKEGRLIPKGEPIHHIDFDRTNNSPDNLYVCKNHSEHKTIHCSLEEIAKQLFKENKIIFVDGRYKLNALTVKVAQEIVKRL